jgi:membrane-bound metal-dependent hydrolase YbcI (DUF457 family)
MYSYILPPWDYYSIQELFITNVTKRWVQFFQFAFSEILNVITTYVPLLYRFSSPYPVLFDEDYIIKLGNFLCHLRFYLQKLFHAAFADFSPLFSSNCNMMETR